MKKSRRSGQRWLVASILTVGVLSLFLSQDQATAERGDDRSPATHATRTDTLTKQSGTISNDLVVKPRTSESNTKVVTSSTEQQSASITNLLQKGEAFRVPNAKTINGQNLQIFPPVVVDYRNDEYTKMRENGELKGRFVPLGLRAGVAAGGCTWNIECDDCDPCTQDRCVIDVAAGDRVGDGKCQYTSYNGQVGGCSDGDPCNGIELCEAGVCQTPGNGTGSQGRPYCAVGALPVDGICVGGAKDGDKCDFGVTPSSCPAPGNCVTAACDVNAPQITTPDDFCVLPCTVAVCKRICSNEIGSVNAGEICTKNGDCPGGSCLPGPPCPGGNGDCDGAQGQTCIVNDDVCAWRDGDNVCNGLETCDVGAGTCSDPDDGVNPCGPGARCSEKSCPGNRVCFSDGDCNTGTTSGQTCEVRAAPGCSTGRCCKDNGDGTSTCNAKKFSACIAPDAWFPGDLGYVDIATCDGAIGCPTYSRGIAPTRDALVNIGIASDSACNLFFEMGDDYETSDGKFIQVERLRFVGQVGGGGRMVIEFFDEFGNFIEDTISDGGEFTGSYGVQVVDFVPPISIPSKGIIVIRTATNFSPNGWIVWASAPVLSTDPGINDETQMWVNGAMTSNWLEICAGGDNDGDWCNPAEAGADCPAGTCTPSPNVLSLEIVGTSIADSNELKGACCDATTGACEESFEWICDFNGGIFSGANTQCATCGIDSPLLGSSCRVCGAGSTNLNESCFANTDCDGGNCVENNLQCQMCEGGTNDGKSCLQFDCSAGGGVCGGVGTCEALPTCLTGACCSPSTGACTENNPGSCTGDGIFSGYGTSCDPNCCLQPVMWGADDCADVTIHDIIVPPSGDPPVVVTISGNNSTAGTTPESCSLWDPTESAPENVDLVWWEGWSIDSCAFVRVDMCCSDPIHEPMGAWLLEGCPCDPGSFRVSELNPNEPDLLENERGAPFCDEDNLWWQFGPLPAGTYYSPILSILRGQFDDYQMHITVTACPEAACCYNTCSAGSSTPGANCAFNSECPGGTCDSACDSLDVLACQAKDGFHLAPPNLEEATPLCGNVCDTGSCCVGNGVCIDDIFEQLVDKADCDGENGTYKGGVRCFGGTCGSAPNVSCRTSADCPGGVGACVGSTPELRQKTPCPICEIQSQSRCQFDSGTGGRWLISDSGVGDGGPLSALADDFVADENGDLNQVCVIGVYADQDLGLAGGCDTPPNPDFTVRLYEDANGRPGTLKGESATIPVGGFEFQDTASTPREFHRFMLTLTDPVVGLLVGQIYWLEVTNNTDPALNGGDPRCDWFWDSAVAGEGNNFLYSTFSGREGILPSYGLDPPWNGDGVRDRAWCININNHAPPAPKRACCTCNIAAPCVDATFAECDVLRGHWIAGQDTCAIEGGGEYACPTTQVPANDNCGDAIVAIDGTQQFSSFCSTPFGQTAMDEVNCGDTSPAQFKADIWYEYTATCTGTARFELCDSAFFDTVLAAYGNHTGTCTCPLNSATQLEECSDDDCVWGGGRSALDVAVTEGDCVIVRVGGFNDEQGIGELDVSCGFIAPSPPPPFPHTYSSGAAACNGGVNYGLPCQTCTGGSRAGLLCLENGDCSGGGTCNADNSLCPAATCGGVIAGGGAATFPWPGNRMVGFKPNPSWAGSQIGVRVNMVTVDGHAACNGKKLWAGPPAEFCEGGTCSTKFWASQLQATAHYMDWSTFSAIQIYGNTVIPGSRYAIQAITQGSDEIVEVNYSDPALLVDTAQWGDVWAPISGFSAAGQPQIADVLKIVDKWLGNLEPRKSRSQLQPAVLNLNSTVGISDVLKGVDAWLATPYPLSVTCP